MRFTASPLAGLFLIDIEPIVDERGFFSRTVCTDQFTQHGLKGNFVQQSVSYNRHAGTLRGLHFQAVPHAEEKLVRVTQGAIFDVLVDLRQDSATFSRWFGVELSAENRRQVYIPQGFAHGFQTLLPDTEILYEMTVAFQPDAARGLRWDDPDVGVDWPDCTQRVMSESDRRLPLFSELK